MFPKEFARVWLAFCLEKKRTGPLFPIGNLGGEFGHDWTPHVAAGLALTHAEAAFVNVSKAKPHDVRTALPGVDVERDPATHDAGQLVMGGT